MMMWYAGMRTFIFAELVCLACVWLMLNLTGLTWIRFLIWMAIGVLIYFAYGRTHSVLALRESATSAR